MYVCVCACVHVYSGPLSSRNAYFSQVSIPALFVAPNVKSAVMFLPSLRDVSRSLDVSVLEMQLCHISHHPKGTRWRIVNVSRRNYRLEIAHVGMLAH